MGLEVACVLCYRQARSQHFPLFYILNILKSKNTYTCFKTKIELQDIIKNSSSLLPYFQLTKIFLLVFIFILLNNMCTAIFWFFPFLNDLWTSYYEKWRIHSFIPLLLDTDFPFTHLLNLVILLFFAVNFHDIRGKYNFLHFYKQLVVFLLLITALIFIYLVFYVPIPISLLNSRRELKISTQFQTQEECVSMYPLP